MLLPHASIATLAQALDNSFRDANRQLASMPQSSSAGYADVATLQGIPAEQFMTPARYALESIELTMNHQRARRRRWLWRPRPVVVVIRIAQTGISIMYRPAGVRSRWARYLLRWRRWLLGLPRRSGP